MGDSKNVRKICEAAAEAFWAKVAELVPEAKTGDLAPESDIPFRKACMDVVRAWLSENLTGTASASCDLVVEMRPPKKGERGWLVEALTAEAALAEVLRESEELGWVADRDHSDAFDENGMHAVTIVLRPGVRALSQDELMKVQGFGVSPMVTVPSSSALLARHRRHDESHDASKPTSEIPPPGDPERIHEDDVWGEFVTKLPEHKGWRATWEYPGYIRWTHPHLKLFVCATPDFHRDNEIAIDVQDDHGESHSIPGIADLFWPVGAIRTPATYLNVIGSVLDKVFSLGDELGETVTVTVLLYKHRHGEDISVYETPDAALRGAAAIMLQFVEELPRRPDREKVLRLIGDSKYEEAIEAWHDADSDERIEISDDVMVLR